MLQMSMLVIERGTQQIMVATSANKGRWCSATDHLAITFAWTITRASRGVACLQLARMARNVWNRFEVSSCGRTHLSGNRAKCAKGGAIDADNALGL